MATNKKPVKRKVGRPSAYRGAESCALVREMSAHGWTDFKIARAMSISEVTLWSWRKKHPEFAAACVTTEEERLEAVRRSLYHRATGYSHDAVKIMTRSIGDGCSEVVREEYVEHYPPDVAAMKFYLTNKSAGEFTEKHEVEQSGGLTVTVIGGLPDEEEDAT